MQRLADDTWVISASDLTQLSQCPWLVARKIDEKLDKGVRVPELMDPMMELVKRLGIIHEDRVLTQLKETLTAVVEIPYDRSVSSENPALWKANISDAASQTVEALGSQADATFQGVFFHDNLPDTSLTVAFQGFADFLVHGDQGWEVWDSKLARSDKDPALIQVAAYNDQLRRLGIHTSPEVRLVLGDGTHSIHDVDSLLLDYKDQRRELLNLLEERVKDPDATPWDDARYVACGTKGCPACVEQIALTDDLFQLAGLRKTQRSKLKLAGFQTLTEFASATRKEVLTRTTGIGQDTLAQLHTQAFLQRQTQDNPEERPAWSVLSAQMLDTLPPVNPGDLFFDFEGDPTYQEFDANNRPIGGLSSGDEAVWFGIEYLFGLWGSHFDPSTDQPGFVSFWAENFAEEKQALIDFCALVDERLEKFPDLHIYHYASYERTRLSVLAARHQVAQPTIDRLLSGVLVDLYPVVMKGVRIGLPSYSLKALEALYFEPGTRSGIAGGGESVAAFVDYLDALSTGNQAEALAIRNSILHYNTIDCFSTEALRNWLLEIKDT